MTPDIPYSFPIEVATIPPHGRDYKLAANADERAAIARAIGLESLERLTADLTVTPGPGRTYAVTGSFAADAVQACVVTLVPVPAHIREVVARRFAASPPPSADEGEENWVDPDAEIVDPLTDGKLDLGEIAVEQLSLSLDPYPRAPGASFAGLAADGTPEAPEGPFAALASLKGAKSVPRRGERPAGRGRKPRPAKRKT